ncbi:centrosomal protein 43-like isoform X2 [Physella acuta]|uniref:centrosomal protein 43-like isoform X2 n=1 Tax=Physella acuta TaxID=109671 RepID=UPI0027DC3E9C|nr:centrosomal protein 43-like isoform X2 [Physella acuta]
MSADEDTELRDLVAQTLETNGTLGKLRAQLRASVFLALEDQENGQSKAPFLNKNLRNFLSTKEGMLVTSLVQEFLEFFNLEFTLAVFKPETGLVESEKRSELLKALGIQPSNIPPNTPLLSALVHSQHSSSGAGDAVYISKDLTEKQIEEARKKFDYYDKDGSGAIEKGELRELFLDMFPSFHRNMLERYVNDEFAAVDRNFSNSLYSLTPKAIDFDEFLGMYKRLFLLCRTVVSDDVAGIITPSQKPDVKLPKQSDSSDHESRKSPPPDNGTSNPLNDGSDIEEDSFFDDHPPAAVSFSTLSSFISERSRSTFLSVPAESVSAAVTRQANPYQPPHRSQQQSELEKNRDFHTDTKLNGESEKGKKSGSGLSSLNGLPSLGAGRASLAGAPPLTRPKSPENDSRMNDSDLDKNLREVDKRIVELGLDSQNDEFEYEDDFSDMSQKSPRNVRIDNKPENGSVAEEIDDEEIAEDISVEADDLMRSEKSGFDDLTTDRSISQIDGGFDYMEDPILP